MARWMPILCQHNKVMCGHHLIDRRHNCIAVIHRQRSAGTKVILWVDYNKTIHHIFPAVAVCHSFKSMGFSG